MLPAQQHSDLTFSVIIPVYNGAGIIARAIDSVLAQSYPALEIIVVDDASTSNTKAVVTDNYAGKVQYIQKIANGGSSIARNVGLDAAKGNCIAFLDADDI